jgi:hypothetical protein
MPARQLTTCRELRHIRDDKRSLDKPKQGAFKAAVPARDCRVLLHLVAKISLTQPTMINFAAIRDVRNRIFRVSNMFSIPS